MENLSSAPCLLDDLMDTGVINVDINFGGQTHEVIDGMKKSPSHESDSGVSIMSSPHHSVVSLSEFDDDDSFKAFSPPCFDNFDNLLDTELSSYLAGGNESDSNDATVSSLVSVSPTIQTDVDRQYQHQLSVESQNSDIVIGKTVAIGASKACEAQTTVAKTLPPVKVIKVITAPKSSSKVEMEKQIFEAIDEKNKKNAKQAKINREKKKAYIKTLEDDVDSLKSENSQLKQKMETIEYQKNALAEEVEYLKSVLANQSTLSSLLKNIPNANLRLSNSFIDRKRGAAHDHDYQGQSKRAKKSTTAGVCLHVENENVSLEFCSSCSKKSKESCG